MKKRGISQYDLYTHYGINRSLLDRLRKNANVQIYTLEKFCIILNCSIEDLVEYIPDEEEDTKDTDRQEPN
jgi:DNA-binding Xre family transcriptional regulator